MGRRLSDEDGAEAGIGVEGHEPSGDLDDDQSRKGWSRSKSINNSILHARLWADDVSSSTILLSGALHRCRSAVKRADCLRDVSGTEVSDRCFMRFCHLLSVPRPTKGAEGRNKFTYF